MVLFSEDENLHKNPMVAGLGAPAVGPEALRLSRSSAGFPGRAFVVVIHRSPGHEGSITSLLPNRDVQV